MPDGTVTAWPLDAAFSATEASACGERIHQERT